MHSKRLYWCLITLLTVKSILAQNVPYDKSSKEQQNAKIKPSENVPPEEHQVLKPEPMFRHRKMFNILNYPSHLYSTAPSSIIHQYDYLNEFPQFDEKDISAAAASSKLVPQPKPYENSPIYYVKLPSTPYMYVPGMGYISESSSIPSMHSQLPSTSLTALFNLPLNFMSNGRPLSIYQFGNDIRPHFSGGQYFTEPTIQRIHGLQSDNYPSDTEVTSLKGNFLYNGRPEEIYVLPKGFKSFYRSESSNYY